MDANRSHLGIKPLSATFGQVRILPDPLSWSHLEPHSEEVEQFLAMLRFEQKSEVKKLSEVLK